MNASNTQKISSNHASPDDGILTHDEQYAISKLLKVAQEKIPNSISLQNKSKDVLALEVLQTIDYDCPVYMAHGEGCRFYDIDGNSYIDLTMGFGAHVLGIKDRSIENAITSQAKKGWHFGVHNTLQAELANHISKANPQNKQIAFCNSGTEATMYAFRLARAYSGKEKIGIFDGAYHGAHDYALAKVDTKSNPENPMAVLQGSGVPNWISEQSTIALTFGSDICFDLIEHHADQLALVVIQPVQNNNPTTEHVDWLANLLQVCRNNSVLCLFDEVVSGFRLAYGGAQELFNLRPDFTVYGKAIGGGLPIGAIAGPQHLMGLLKSATTDNGVFFGGTFNGNPLAMAAGSAALSSLYTDQSEIYTHLRRQSDRLASTVNSHAKHKGYDFQVVNTGSLICLHFQKGKIRTYRDIKYRGTPGERAFYIALLNRGVIIPAIHLAFLSYAHTADDVDKVINAIKASLDEVHSLGLL